MPAPLGPLLGLILGLGFGHQAARRRPASQSGWMARSALVVVLFAFLIYGPYTGYFLTYGTEWAFFYRWPVQSLPSAMLLVLALANVGSVLAGFAALRSRLLRRYSVHAALPITILGALGLTILFLARHPLAQSTTVRARALGASPQPLFESSLGQAVLVLGLCLIAGIFWTMLQLQPPAPPGQRRKLGGQPVSRQGLRRR